MSLSSIVTALAGVSVTVNGVTPLTWEPNSTTRKLKARYDTSDLPARLVMPFGSDIGVTARALTIGGTAKTLTVTPVDLLLWDTVGQQDLPTVFPALAAYIDAYNSAIRAKIRLTATPVAIVEGWTFAPDIYTYGGVQYWGVEVRLTVKETS